MSVVIRTNTSAKIAELSAITQPNQKGYAAKHGYEWVCEEFDYEHFNDNIIAELQSWRSLLEKNDTVMWVGADVMFTNWNLPIEFVDVGSPMLMAREETSWWPINNDVMIFNNAPETFDFIDRMIKDFDIWKHYPWRMQTHTWNLIQEEEWANDSIYIVSAKEMNQHPSRWQLGDWIIHFYGMPLEEKVVRAREIAELIPGGNPVLKVKVDGGRPPVL